MLGDSFKGPYLKPYYMKYTENYANAQSILKECEKVALFEKWLDVSSYYLLNSKLSTGSATRESWWCHYSLILNHVSVHWKVKLVNVFL
jgi:hypothetical protein